MTATEVLERVTEQYGEPTITRANGVVVAVVPTCGGGVSIGCGSDPSSAICDLYLELHAGEDRRGDVPWASQPWEVTRRQRRVDRLTNQVSSRKEDRGDG